MKKKYLIPFLLKLFLLLLVSSFCITQSKGQSNSWPVPKAAADLQNPLASNSNSIKNGMTLYQSYCAPCHGKNGKGDGPAATSLHPKPADHTSAAVQAESDGTLFYKISEGHNNTAMPPFKSVLTADQRWAIINYIRTLSRK